MCKTMTEFEKLVEAIQLKKADREKLKEEIKTMEEELKSYMKKRQKEEIVSKVTGLTVSFKNVDTPKFNKELFIQANSEKTYQKYLVVTSSMRLNYLKPKKVKA
ncbi:hypothetical protein [Lacrimispora indolis]|uniref:hypothetical protein n=1 Tax=Lacrimispora indolis TaxID=69825 RepID=UPI00041C5AD5|nr:hypothetical protein [[Clostridium] methoxybenzovorans]